MVLILERMETNAGFMQNCAVDFLPGLNCIIGARGTCKSTLVESILFAFDFDPARVQALIARQENTGVNDAYGMIASTLQSGTVRVGVSSQAFPVPDAFSVEREIGSTPRVYQDGVREYADPGTILGQIEIYSQGELLRIAKDDARRIELIDRPHKNQIDEWKNQRSKAAGELAQAGSKLRELRSQINQLTYEIRDLATRRQDLAEALASRPRLPAGLETQLKTQERRRATMANLEGLKSLQADMAQHSSDAVEFVNRLAEVNSLLLDSGFEDSDLPGVVGVLAQLLEVANALVAAGPALREIDVTGEVERLSVQFSKESDAYYRVRGEQEAVNEALKREDLLRKQVEHLEKISLELGQAKSDEAALTERRRRLRAEIRAFNEDIYAVRAKEIASINRDHAQFVLLNLVSGTQSRAYVEQLADILKGSRLQSQDGVAGEIATQLSPADLIEIVESGNHQALATLLGRDLSQSSRIITHLEHHDRLYELESQIPDDVLEISMYDNGEPKPVESLSNGQKATALLPLILRPLPYPLIIDQPEDDLDNRFIFQSLVATVRHLKLERQIIFVTHNANLPVLGGADRVIVMSMNGPFEANPPLVGTVDERAEEIIGLLEGGKDAFLERQHRYEAMLAPAERA